MDTTKREAVIAAVTAAQEAVKDLTSEEVMHIAVGPYSPRVFLLAAQYDALFDGEVDHTIEPAHAGFCTQTALVDGIEFYCHRKARYELVEVE